MRLILIGDDEALDVLAELSQHLRYFEVARLDDLPDRPFVATDHVVVAFTDRTRVPGMLELVLRHGEAGLVRAVPVISSETPGARAIVVAAELVSAVRDAAPAMRM
jgi:hypothetical protein